MSFCQHCEAFDALQAENSELRAKLLHFEQHEKIGKRPFSDRFAQRVIEDQIKEIDRLHEALAARRQADV